MLKIKDILPLLNEEEPLTIFRFSKNNKCKMVFGKRVKDLKNKQLLNSGVNRICTDDCFYGICIDIGSLKY